ncbi:DNA helicase-2/ATP-dependent DNA helicase PcrA [Bacillus mesophilus]|uniref:UvrD-helicase domain-containing protein n=1 Tax=Bacillus mesophilus TaxID=1808955 RepID=A0A6M0QEA7_9BACI|nr:RNA polymerase recycling motor HelD [Bacillus mesophilus]MBM7663073.1 DNA helicase-2/ATP-dependent DNA helicase PcrA [Bacillus mesophilus]NEY73608.1 UvrD-helicase domain-containing protein [Bacillus mesophilus]
MSISPQEWQQEQNRVNNVVSEVQKKMDSMQKHLTSIKTDIVEIRKSFWEDVRVNVDEPHELIETFTTIKQQAEFLSERERSHGHGYGQITKLERLRQSPYFGRIDVKFEEEEETNTIYLGIASFLDEDDSFLIYDWRAPISSLYYDSLPGDVDFQAPSGTVSGSMALKRQFIIKDSEIKGMFDTGLAIGDELLQEVLGKHSDVHMKTIVATIQKEQNNIIRNDESDLLVVQGAAGSGKTSAALQRVAYLLYRYRETIQAEHILLFSPNTLFNHYVSSVLPELGEKNMQQTTYQDFIHNKLSDDVEIESPFTLMEYTLNAQNHIDYKDRMKGIDYKSSPAFIRVLNRYLEWLQRDGLVFKDIVLGDKVLISSSYIKELFYKFDMSISIPNKIQLVKEHLSNRLKKIAKKEIHSKWVEDEIQYLDKEDYLKAYQKLQRKNKKHYTNQSFNDMDSEQQVLSKMVVREHFRPIQQQIKDSNFIDFISIYEGMYMSGELPLPDIPEEWEDICALTMSELEKNRLYYEDAAPYLYLKEQIQGTQKNTSVRHIFIDEAQDYSVVQLATLFMLFPNSRFTLLGDFNQAIFPQSLDGTIFQDDHIDKKKSKQVITLTKSYRSTKQIVEFTKMLLKESNHIEPFNREGKLPIVTSGNSEQDLIVLAVNQIHNQLRNGTANIALICKTAAESQDVYEKIKDMVEIKLIKGESSTFEEGVVVVPAYLAKGIEFDTVILYNASEYKRETERKLFYTACTRAMHELLINELGKQNPFLQDVDHSLYARETFK